MFLSAPPGATLSAPVRSRSHRLRGQAKGGHGAERSELELPGPVTEGDPATLVLTGYARMNGGTARGDEELAGRFRDPFFPI